MANEHIITISFQDPNVNLKASQEKKGNYASLNDSKNSRSDLLHDTGLEKNPVEVNCSYCNANIQTWVEKRLRQGSCFFPVMCMFCGNFLLIFLAICMDAFREWRHYCPRCNSFLGRFIPTTSGNVLAAMIMTTLSITALEICLIFTYFEYWNEIKDYYDL